MRRRRLLLSAAALPLPAAGRAVADPGDPVRALLSERVDAVHDSLGLVVGVVDAGGTQVVAAGVSGAAVPLDGDTVFEVGSVTKVFTALLLAEMAQRGEVALDDPVARFLPPEARPSEGPGPPVRLIDLATNTSGLPRLPANFHPRDPADPYADYTVAQLEQAARTTVPGFPPGSGFLYSNLGFGLLGHALALRAGRGYEELLDARICEPLGLDSTRITLTPAMRARLAPGHDADLQPVPGWRIPTLPGAGALHSTVHDMLRFLDAARGRRTTPLAAAFARLLAVRRPTGTPRVEVAAGWFINTPRGADLVWKDGGTGGYSAMIGFTAERAAVLLSNTAGTAVPLLGFHLIDPALPLPPLRREVAVDPARLARLAGHYALSPTTGMDITAAEGRLRARITGQPAFRLYAESDTAFFCRAVPARISFELGPDGAATALVLHQNGRDRRWPRQP